MTSWATFQTLANDIAASGRRLLSNERGDRLAFLATVSRSGPPHIAPVCPIFAGDDICLCIAAHTPKRLDLQRDNRYALHAFLGENDAEFCLSGHAHLIEDADEIARVHAAMRFNYRRTDPIYKLDIERAFWGYWENTGRPDTRPVRRRWVQAPG